MREILFKAKAITGGFIEGYLFKNWGDAYILWGEANGNPVKIKVDPNTVCQYTGLTDRKGVKIFEGDIIDTYTAHGQSPVFYQNGSYKINGANGIVGFGSFAKQVEVIGNIHD